MQIFTCPFCGPRDEREFHFAGEAGKTRPDTTTTIAVHDWAHYLHTQRNEKGVVHEVWMHITCHKLFMMTRNSATMDVLSSNSIPEEVSS